MATSRMAKSSRALEARRAHLGEGHLLVGFVDEIESAAAAGVVAHHAVEDDDGAVFGTFEAGDDGVGVDAVVNDGDMWAGAFSKGIGGAAADRGQQGDFVAVG